MKLNFQKKINLNIKKVKKMFKKNDFPRILGSSVISTLRCCYRSHCSQLRTVFYTLNLLNIVLKKKLSKNYTNVQEKKKERN